MVESGENNPWKGADLVTARKVLVDPYGNALIPVLVGPNSIPSTDIEEIGKLGSSTRSRNAQLHLEMEEGAPRMIAGQIVSRGFENKFFIQQIPMLVPVRNYSPRKIEIPRSTQIGRLHRLGQEIIGEELQAIIDSHQIDAEELILRYSNGYKKRPENLIGATVAIDSKMRMGLPFSSNELNLADFQGTNYRDLIDAELVHLPDSNNTGLWIGNTGMEIGLVEGVDAVLSKGVYLSPTNRDDASFVGEHINARLLDGGKKWLIRVEVWGKAIRGLAQNYIDINFYKGVNKPEKE